MKKDDVPQDDSSTYAGHKKVIYATDGDNHYQTVESCECLGCGRMDLAL